MQKRKKILLRNRFSLQGDTDFKRKISHFKRGKSLIIKSNNYFLNISMADKERRIEIGSGAFSVIHYVWFVSSEFLWIGSIAALSRQLSVVAHVFPHEIKHDSMKSECIIFSPAWSFYFYCIQGWAEGYATLSLRPFPICTVFDTLQTCSQTSFQLSQ